MKARVKATGEIVDVAYLSEDKYGNKYYNVTTDTRTYRETELERMSDKGDYFYTYDYWEKLKHQYAGMVMQGFLAGGMENTYEYIVEFSINQATALVERLQEKQYASINKKKR